MDSMRGFICQEFDSSAESEEYEDKQFNISSHQKSYLPSESSKSKKVKCLSKNALMARENRRRKKLYVESIERESKYLREMNRRLEVDNRKKNRDMTILKREVSYLRSVMSNSSSIEKLLKAINTVLNPNVIVKTENSTDERPVVLSGPLIGDPFLSSSSNVNHSEFPAVQEQISNQEDLPLHSEELPQSLEEKILKTQADHLTKDLKGAVIFRLLGDMSQLNQFIDVDHETLYK